MQTVTLLIQMGYALTFLVVPWLARRRWKRRKRGRLGFDLRMANDGIAQRFVAMVALTSLCLLHYCWMRPDKSAVWLLPTTAIACVLFSTRASSRLFSWLTSRGGQKTAFALVLLTMFVPQGFPFAFTVAVLLLAAYFLPSDAVIARVNSPGFYTDFLDHMNGKEAHSHHLDKTSKLLLVNDSRKSNPDQTH